MAEQPLAESRYHAVLSSSHKDAAAAGRLHRRLESYRLPRRLVGRMTACGLVPDRLWPIFRDREELPAATDLSETVRNALAQSDSLIVLCSHHSATSLWVAEEIETFRVLHADRPILAAILDGDPPDCFPGALRAFDGGGRPHEPLATDLRPGRDGAHLGLLKLIAGITGIGLDALVQRDAARKIRRVTAVTGAALVALLVMTALTWFALDARREAERQRAAAEGLVEFMLTDLRRELRGVGRLDVMSTVNRRALAYYDRQQQGGSTRSDLAMRARVMHALGEDYLRRGDIAAARAWLLPAYRMTASLAERSPNDPDIIFAHGQSEYWLGRVHVSRGEWAAAQRRFERYAQAAYRLIEIVPRDPAYMMEVAWAAQNLGEVQLGGLQDAVAAQSSFERAVRWFQRAAIARPDDIDPRHQEANARGWLADSLLAQGRRQSSLAVRLDQLRIMESVHQAQPDNQEVTYLLAAAERAVAQLYGQAGHPEAGRPFLLNAYRRSHQLTARDPVNAEWLVFQAMVECLLLAEDPRARVGVSDAELGRSLRATTALLSARGNAQAAAIGRCHEWAESRRLH